MWIPSTCECQCDKWCKSGHTTNTLQNVFIGLFSVALLIGIICFCVFAYFKWFKGKKLFKKYIDY